jgi:hypothetical protein
MAIQERYTPKVVGVDSAVTITNLSLAGFLAKTSGTISIVDSAGTTIVDAHPVTAGGYYPLPFYLGVTGGTFTTAGGASGTIAV